MAGEACTSGGRAVEVAFVAVGSNLGHREGHLRAALAALAASEGVEFAGASAIYETAPVGPPQGAYLNAVVRVVTALAPVSLLERLLDIERERGRVRGEPDAPRTLDLDLLLYGERVEAGPQLTLPHPRLHQRRFVLVPLAELAPQLVHPVFEVSIAELLAACAATPGDVRRFAPAPATDKEPRWPSPP